MPPPVRSTNSARARATSRRRRHQFDQRGADGAPGRVPERIDGRREAAEGVARPVGIAVVGPRRPQHRAADVQARGRRVPRVLDVVVGGVVRLPGRERLAKPRLADLGRRQLGDLRHERVVHRHEVERLLDLPREFLRLLAERGRPRQLEVAIGDLRHRVIGQADARPRHPVGRDLAMGDAPRRAARSARARRGCARPSRARGSATSTGSG